MASTARTVLRFAAVLASVSLLAYISAALQPVRPIETISADEYNTLLAVLPVRAGEEPYTTIPWETSLTVAQQKARAEHKPMLIWSMDGHPLGCG